MKIISIPNFARYESSFAFLSDEIKGNDLQYFTIDEERLSREKHTYSFPLLAMEYCMQQAGVESLDEIDLLITDYARRPSMYNDGPGYRKLEHDYLKGIIDLPRDKIVMVNHHDAHAAGVFYPSGFNESAIIIVDGMGSDLETQSIYYGDGNGIRCIEKGYGWGIGALYSEVTNLIGFTGLNGVDLAGKTMGLAPLGRNVEEQVLDIKAKYSGISSDYSNFITRFPKPKIIQKNLKRCDDPSETTSPYYTKIAYEVQKEAEKAIVEFANRAYDLTKCKNLCISGGVGLNSVANGKVLENTPIENLYVTPCCSDTGIALAMSVYGYFEHYKAKTKKQFRMKNAFTGRNYCKKNIKKLLDDLNIVYKKRCYDTLAKELDSQKIMAWFVGGSEIGPRALGHRSILVDPRRKEMKDILNARVKHREAFRPFAPAILEEHVSEYFPIKHKTPFMLEVYEFLEEAKDKVGAVVHDDGTGRLQTVSKEECEEYYNLISAFYEITGIPILLNTSFNDKEPIVESPRDALITFLSTDIDILVLEEYVIYKDSLSKELLLKIPEKLRDKRKADIELDLSNSKNKYFKNYSIKQRDNFLKEEELQSIWHLKYRAKYELERFIDRQRKNPQKIIIIGESNHTEILYNKIYNFTDLNIMKFIPYRDNEVGLLDRIYDIGSMEDINKGIWEKILISSHEFQYNIIEMLNNLGIENEKIFYPYDNAGDSLEVHLEYLPTYNPIK